MFKLAVCSNINVGVREDLENVCNDPYEALSEILNKSVENKVDCLIIAGNLFFGSVISNYCFSKTFSLLKQKVLGDGEINFITKNFLPNYANENINVQLPIFAIHGTNDRPTNDKLSTCLDTFDESLYLNYCGKIMKFDEKITINPVVLDKGDLKIALYMLGHIKDVKLSTLLAQKKIEFVVPSDADIENYFHILVVNQKKSKDNRRLSFPTKDIFVEDFPEFFNLIIWGDNSIGSERIVKHASGKFLYHPPPVIDEPIGAYSNNGIRGFGLVEIEKNEIKLNNIPLPMLRPVIYQKIPLSSLLYKHNEQVARNVLEKKSQVKYEWLIDSELVPILEVFNEKITNYKNKAQVKSHSEMESINGSNALSVEDLLYMDIGYLRKRLLPYIKIILANDVGAKIDLQYLENCIENKVINPKKVYSIIRYSNSQKMINN